MDIKNKIAEITQKNGYAYCPSSVYSSSDSKAKKRVRSVAVDGNTVSINASGRCLEAIKQAIREKCPGVTFADEKPKKQEIGDATAETS